MKLSAAIRIGSMTTVPLWGRATDGKNGRCAIGAAIDACGVKVDPIHWGDQFQRLWPEHFEITQLIWYLNDIAHWTREEIADLVENIENGKSELDLSPRRKELINDPR